LAAFERLDGKHRLVVGARGWRDGELTDRLKRKGVDVLGRVDDEELVTLYRGASCLLFPSPAEGFGFPLLEAMACGAPVVCADSGSLPQVAGGAARLAPSHDHDAIAGAIAEVLADPKHWRERGLARAARFTWARCAEQTVRVYREAAA
jgi:glycosyltransferase involved in cell wall biosynthesis